MESGLFSNSCFSYSRVTGRSAEDDANDKLLLLQKLLTHFITSCRWITHLYQVCFWWHWSSTVHFSCNIFFTVAWIFFQKWRLSFCGRFTTRFVMARSCLYPSHELNHSAFVTNKKLGDLHYIIFRHCSIWNRMQQTGMSSESCWTTQQFNMKPYFIQLAVLYLNYVAMKFPTSTLERNGLWKSKVKVACSKLGRIMSYRKTWVYSSQSVTVMC